MLTPLSPDDCNTLFQALESEKRIAIAVSGGPDSTALMILLDRWAKARPKPPKLFVLTVDHGLRVEASQEAELVGSWAARVGLPHQILHWDEPKPRSNIQAKARTARYELLMAACHAANIGALVTAHHLEDQAETFLLRLARGSGIDGLSAMEPISFRQGIKVVRPLLDIQKERLEASLSAIKHPWTNDPSNNDDAFSRIKVRNLRPALAEIGMTPQRLAATAQRMRRAQVVLDRAADQLAHDAVQLNEAGYCTIQHENFVTAPEDTALRLLARCLMAIGGIADRPRYNKITNLHASLTNDNTCRRTFWGCQILRRGEQIWIWREAGRSGLPTITIRQGEPAIWDNRFTVQFGMKERLGGPANLVVRALGQDGARQIDSVMPDLPAKLKRTFVSFWHENQLVTVPHVDWNNSPHDCRAIFQGRIILDQNLLANSSF